MSRKDFHKWNTPFVCRRCGEHNPSAEKSERNHCRKCLVSLHVDEETPGDRKSSCGGLMIPVGIDHKGKKGFMIVHECVECGKKMKNTLMEDDNKEVMKTV